MQAMPSKVLVTGAAGGLQGSTGRMLTQLLLERGVAVRALVRSNDERAAALREAGAEVVVGDLLNYEDVLRAAAGVEYIYFTFAVQDGLLEGTTIMALAASKAGVKGIINNSQFDTALDSLSPQARRHALAEAVLDAFPTPVVHLKGGMYTSNLYFQLGDLVSATGVLAAPAVVATDKIPLINSSDVAHAADAVLKDFDRYANQALQLAAQLHSMSDIAADFGAVLGKEVRFETVTTEAWREELIKASQRRTRPSTAGARGNLTAVVHLTALWGVIHQRNQSTDLVPLADAAIARLEALLGRKPRTIRESIQEHYVQEASD